MKILFIAHYFQPEPGFFFALPFAKALEERGHKVEIITGFPNYPAGKLLDGYRQKLKMVEYMDGIKVTRVPLYISHDNSTLRRIISYSSLSFSQAVIGSLCRFDADIAFVSQGPATIGLPSMLFKWLKKIPFVYQIQDLWPDSLSASGMFSSRIGLKMVHSWCNLVYRQAKHIAVISPGMKDCLIERGVPKDKISTIYNCGNAIGRDAFQDVVLPETLASLFRGDTFNVLYAGNLGAMQSLEVAVNAAEMLRTHPNIRFILLGNGVEAEKLKNLAKEKNLTNIFFHPYVTPVQAAKAVDLSDAVFSHLRKIPLFDMTVPSKIQGYLAAGKPIIAAVGHDAAKLVEEAGAGIGVEPENPRQLADAVMTLAGKERHELVKMGMNGMNFYNSNMGFQMWVSKYENLFKSLL